MENKGKALREKKISFGMIEIDYFFNLSDKNLGGNWYISVFKPSISINMDYENRYFLVLSWCLNR